MIEPSAVFGSPSHECFHSLLPITSRKLFSAPMFGSKMFFHISVETTPGTTIGTTSRSLNQ